MNVVDQDDMERMQSVENLLSLANGDVEEDCADDDAGLEDDTNATVDTMALSVSDDYQPETHQPQLATEVDGYLLSFFSLTTCTCNWSSG